MNLKEKYIKQVIPEMKKNLGCKNIFEVPKINKVIINVGLNINQTSNDPKFQELVEDSVMRISGQRPVKKLAKKSISGFKIRKGQVVGVMVTLRGQRMYDFVDKLINVTMPRERDFRGIDKKNVDKSGNLSIGFKEQIVFPELSRSEVTKVHGIEVVVVTSAKNREEGLELLKLLGFPFSK